MTVSSANPLDKWRFKLLGLLINEARVDTYEPAMTWSKAPAPKLPKSIAWPPNINPKQQDFNPRGTGKLG